MIDQDALELVRLRNNFYRDGYRRVLGAVLIMALINLILGAALIYMILNPTKPQYFATTREGKLVRMYSLSQPIVSTSELLQWAATAATAANTYNFVNYRKEMQNASEYFTPTGWQAFQNELKNSRTLETVLSKKLTVSAVATGSPIIIEQGVQAGKYKWKVQLPILVTYESANTKISQPSVVTMLISRVSTLETVKGIAIDAFIMSEQPLR
ncbi:MAG: type IVB secretion system apparatus protein IcmL/DotI [Gammaproteobacteria bacterium]